MCDIVDHSPRDHLSDSNYVPICDMWPLSRELLTCKAVRHGVRLMNDISIGSLVCGKLRLLPYEVAVSCLLSNEVAVSCGCCRMRLWSQTHVVRVQCVYGAVNRIMESKSLTTHNARLVEQFLPTIHT